jgi:hypothetical protein
MDDLDNDHHVQIGGKKKPKIRLRSSKKKSPGRKSSPPRSKSGSPKKHPISIKKPIGQLSTNKNILSKGVDMIANKPVPTPTLPTYSKDSLITSKDIKKLVDKKIETDTKLSPTLSQRDSSLDNEQLKHSYEKESTEVSQKGPKDRIGTRPPALSDSDSHSEERSTTETSIDQDVSGKPLADRKEQEGDEDRKSTSSGQSATKQREQARKTGEGLPEPERETLPQETESDDQRKPRIKRLRPQEIGEKRKQAEARQQERGAEKNSSPDEDEHMKPQKEAEVKREQRHQQEENGQQRQQEQGFNRQQLTDTQQAPIHRQGQRRQGAPVQSQTQQEGPKRQEKDVQHEEDPTINRQQQERPAQRQHQERQATKAQQQQQATKAQQQQQATKAQQQQQATEAQRQHQEKQATEARQQGVKEAQRQHQEKQQQQAIEARRQHQERQQQQAIEARQQQAIEARRQHQERQQQQAIKARQQQQERQQQQAIEARQQHRQNLQAEEVRRRQHQDARRDPYKQDDVRGLGESEVSSDLTEGTSESIKDSTVIPSEVPSDSEGSDFSGDEDTQSITYQELAETASTTNASEFINGLIKKLEDICQKDLLTTLNFEYRTHTKELKKEIDKSRQYYDFSKVENIKNLINLCLAFIYDDYQDLRKNLKIEHSIVRRLKPLIERLIELIRESKSKGDGHDHLYFPKNIYPTLNLYQEGGDSPEELWEDRRFIREFNNFLEPLYS